MSDYRCVPNCRFKLWVANSIQTRSHTFIEIDPEILSTAILPHRSKHRRQVTPSNTPTKRSNSCHPVRLFVVEHRINLPIYFLTSKNGQGGLIHSEKKSKLQQIVSQCRFPTMWYVRPAKPQISLCIRAV